MAEDDIEIGFTDWQWSLIAAALAQQKSVWLEAVASFPDCASAHLYRESASKADYMINKINQAKQEKSDG